MPRKQGVVETAPKPKNTVAVELPREYYDRVEDRARSWGISPLEVLIEAIVEYG